VPPQRRGVDGRQPEEAAKRPRLLDGDSGNRSFTIATIFASSILPVPSVSTMTETGSATPMA